MNYFQRLIRRALAQQEPAGRIPDDPFAATAPWPLDPQAPLPVLQPPAPPPAVGEGGQTSSQQPAVVLTQALAAAEPLASQPPDHGQDAASPPGVTAAQAARPAPVPGAQLPPTPAVAPPSLAQCLRPAPRPTPATEDSLLQAADAFMGQFGRPLPAGRLRPVQEATEEPIPLPAGNHHPGPGPADSNVPSLDPPAPPGRLSASTTGESQAPMANRSPVEAAATPAPDAPRRQTAPESPVQVLVVQPQSVHGPASRLGSGAPHLGLGQL